jgi:hypothetical protein
MVGAAKQALERGVGGDVHDSQRNRQLLTPESARSALAVPPRGETWDNGADVTGHSESLAKHLGNLAHGHDVPLMAADRSRKRAAPWTARTRGGLSGSANAFMIPTMVWAGDPNMTGLKYFSKAPSANIADEISASVVHPAETKRQPKYVWVAAAGSTPIRSARRIATKVHCNPCSKGNPMAISVARQNDPITSAVRTSSGSGATSTTAPTLRFRCRSGRPRRPADLCHCPRGHPTAWLKRLREAVTRSNSKLCPPSAGNGQESWLGQRRTVTCDYNG